jgi:hypothetical protein
MLFSCRQRMKHDQVTISYRLTWAWRYPSDIIFRIGNYSSATSLSEDTKLRQSIRKYAIDQSRLLDSIGTAQMEQELRKTVLTIAKKQSDRMVEESGVQPSLSEDDMKQYLEEVIREIKVMR